MREKTNNGSVEDSAKLAASEIALRVSSDLASLSTHLSKLQKEDCVSAVDILAPKRLLELATGTSQKTTLDRSKRHGWSYHNSGDTVGLFGLLADSFKVLTDHAIPITRSLRAKRHAKEAEDGDDEDCYDYWDARRIKAVALLKEHDYEERLGRYQPIDIVIGLLERFYVEPNRKRIEALQKRDDPVCSEIAEAIRLDIRVMEQEVENLLGDGDEREQSGNADSAA